MENNYSSMKFFLLVNLLLINVAYSQTSETRWQAQKKCKANVSIGGITQYGSINKEELLKQKGIYMQWEGNCDEYKKSFIKIRSFEIRTYINGNSVSLASSSDQFTEQQKNILKKLTSGTYIHFEQIKVQATDGVRGMEPLYIRVK